MSMVKTEWTDEMAIAIGGRFINAFQRNSYLARVEYDDGGVVVVALPRGARQWGTARWEPHVHAYAAELRRNGRSHGVMPDADPSDSDA